MRRVVVEGKLAVQHREQQHAERPHVTRLSVVQPTFTTIIAIIETVDYFHFISSVLRTLLDG